MKRTTRYKEMLHLGIRRPDRAISHLITRLGIPYNYSTLSNIILYVNSICNAQCPFCDVGIENRWKKTTQGISRLRKSSIIHMPIETLNKILKDKYVEKKKPLFYLIMTESLLSPNIGQIINNISQKGFPTAMGTNGYYLADKAEEIVNNGIKGIQVSIDGPPEIDNFLRGKDFFERAILGIRKLNDLSFKSISVNCVVSNLNYNKLTDFVNALLSEDIEIARLNFQFMDFVSLEMAEEQNSRYEIRQDISSISDLIELQQINATVLKKQLVEASEIIRKHEGIETWITPPLSDVEQISRYFSAKGEPIRGFKKCNMPFYQVAIKTDGTVYFHLRCFNYAIGNINENNLREIYFGGKAVFFRKEPQKANYCFPACTRCCGVTYG